MIFWQKMTYSIQTGIVLFASLDNTNDFIIIRENYKRISFYYENTINNFKKRDKTIDNKDFVITGEWVTMAFTISESAEVKIFQNSIDADYFGAKFILDTPTGNILPNL